MRYNIPKEISSEMKFTKSLYLFDIICVLSAMVFAYITSPLVYAKLVFLYYIFIALSAIFLVSKSLSNPGKRNFQSIYYVIKRNKCTYYRE